MWTPNPATLRLQAIKSGKTHREPETKNSDKAQKDSISGKKIRETGKIIPQTVKTSDKKKGKKRIKNRSKKQAATMRKLAKLYPVFLATRPDCRIKSPVCLGAATVVNHDKGRGANVQNQDDWTECCPPCNDYIEAHHEWAREKGFKKLRHGKKSIAK